MNRAERRKAARDMTHATQSIMRARGGYISIHAPRTGSDIPPS